MRRFFRRMRSPGERHQNQGYRDPARGVEGWSVKNQKGAVVARRLKLPRGVLEELGGALREYEQRFGKPPDPEMTLVEVAARIGKPLPSEGGFIELAVEAMEKAGTAPEYIHAFRKTRGLLISEANRPRVDEKDLRAWEAAVAEYRAAHA